MKVPNPTAIRAARKAARLTQADLAEAIGKSRETVSRLEKGDRGAGLSTVDRIAATCGVQPEFLKMEIPDAEISKPWASTEDERELLRRYRQMPKAAAVGLLLHAWRSATRLSAGSRTTVHGRRRITRRAEGPARSGAPRRQGISICRHGRRDHVACLRRADAIRQTSWLGRVAMTARNSRASLWWGSAEARSSIISSSFSRMSARMLMHLLSGGTSD